MIRKKRYLAAKMGLLALGLMLLFPGQAEAADKKTIYNSPTPALKKHMDRLDQLTGRKNSVKDIYKAYKTHDFHGDPETEKTIKSIGKIFQRQEMQIKAVIPER